MRYNTTEFVYYSEIAGEIGMDRRVYLLIAKLTIESAHAVAYARKIVPNMRKDQSVVITISGRGDKDCVAIARYRGEDLHE